MRNVLVVLEYDGTAFRGFQLQSSGRTVQGELEAALKRIIGEPVRVAGAGRTDAGVHAKGQVATFATATRLETPSLVRALNAVLPDDVAVRAARDVPTDFHARFSASARAYRYTVWNAEYPTPTRRLYTYHWRGPLDVDAMRRAAEMLVGTHDFASFAGAQSASLRDRPRSTLRTVFAAGCRRQDEIVEVDLVANAFLPHMVRNVVGTLLQVGSGRIDRDEFAAVLEARDRRVAGPTAPARGLCLMDVYYDRCPGSALAQDDGLGLLIGDRGGHPGPMAGYEPRVTEYQGAASE